jgi:hypothetical protein
LTDESISFPGSVTGPTTGTPAPRNKNLSFLSSAISTTVDSPPAVTTRKQAAAQVLTKKSAFYSPLAWVPWKSTARTITQGATMNKLPKVPGELAPEHMYSISATKHTLGSLVPKLASIKNPPQTDWIHDQFKLLVYPGNRPRLFGHLTGRELFNAIVNFRL